MEKGVSMWALNLYVWISAIGFPILLAHWLNYENKICKTSYRIGREDGRDEAAKLLEGAAHFVKREHYGVDFQNARYECAKVIRNLRADDQQKVARDK